MLRTFCCMLTVLCFVPISSFGAYQWEAVEAKDAMEAAKLEFESCRDEMNGREYDIEVMLDDHYGPARYTIWQLYPQHCPNIEHEWLEEIDNAEEDSMDGDYAEEEFVNPNVSAAEIHEDTGDSWYEQGGPLYLLGDNDYEEYDHAIYNYNEARSYYDTAAYWAGVSEVYRNNAVQHIEQATNIIINWIDYYNNE